MSNIVAIDKYPIGLSHEVNWAGVYNHAIELSERIQKKHNVQTVMGIGRGGLIPSVIMSHQLGVPLVPIMWQNRDGEYKTSLNSLIEALNEGDTILLVDDISDSGKTLSQIVGKIMYLSDTLKKKIKIVTAALYQKDESLFWVHEYGELVSKDIWIILPWER